MREIPLDSSFSVESATGGISTGMEIRATSSRDALSTSTYLLSALAELGYETNDNASRLLEGTRYTKQQGRVHNLFIRLDLDADDRCRIVLLASR